MRCTASSRSTDKKKNIFHKEKARLNRLLKLLFLGSKLKSNSKFSRFITAKPTYELQSELISCRVHVYLLFIQFVQKDIIKLLLVLQMVTVLLSFGPVQDYTGLISCNKFFSNTHKTEEVMESRIEISSQGLLKTVFIWNLLFHRS